MSTLNIGGHLILNNDFTVGGGEVKTGATWNGKPVYAKAVSVNNISPVVATKRITFQATVSVSHMDQPVDCHGHFTGHGGSSDGITFSIPGCFLSTDASVRCCGMWNVTATKGSFVVRWLANTNATDYAAYTSGDITVVVYYTKTTD